MKPKILNAKNIMKTNLVKISLSMKIFYGFADWVVCVSKGVANSINKISYVLMKEKTDFI